MNIQIDDKHFTTGNLWQAMTVRSGVKKGLTLIEWNSRCYKIATEVSELQTNGRRRRVCQSRPGFHHFPAGCPLPARIGCGECLDLGIRRLCLVR